MYIPDTQREERLKDVRSVVLGLGDRKKDEDNESVFITYIPFPGVGGGGALHYLWGRLWASMKSEPEFVNL